jgi:hypothetical protein
LQLVYRVNWLRASARAQRWEEEVSQLEHEMTWTVAFFRHKKEEWKTLALKADDVKSGLACYAFKQANTWERFEKQAELLFNDAKSNN